MRRALLTAVLAGLPTLASAHPGPGAHDLLHGFVHPLGGFDHVLAMVAVGLYATQLGGRALWLVPASFVAVMAAAGALGYAGIALPHVEAGIAVSLVVLGTAIALRLNLPAAIAMALVGGLAIFHGHAHGTEMTADAYAPLYGLGFVAATVALHGVGIGLGLLLGKADTAVGHRIARLGGGAAAIVGVALLGGMI